VLGWKEGPNKTHQCYHQAEWKDKQPNKKEGRNDKNQGNAPEETMTR